MNEKDKIVLYEDKQGNVELRADAENDTLWATQEQVTRLFNIDQSVASRHIRNIIKSGEVDEKSNMQKMHIANSDRPITLYSLDIILAVGYRTNSGKAIMFRHWASSVLKEHVMRGYSLNKYKLGKSPQDLENLNNAIAIIQSPELKGKIKAKIRLNITKDLI